MTVLPIILSPDPLLKQVSKPVTDVTVELRTLVDDMFDTMYASNGVGLSAVQVGVLLRVIVVDAEWGSSRYETEASPLSLSSHAPASKPITMLNPEITEKSLDQRIYDEGCLSFPGQYSEVSRPDIITVEYQNLNGEKHSLVADGLLSTCIQHEIDHMNGIVFIDHISRIKRDVIVRKMKKAQKQQALEN